MRQTHCVWLVWTLNTHHAMPQRFSTLNKCHIESPMMDGWMNEAPLQNI